MDYLQEDYYPPPPSTSTVSIPQSRPQHPPPTTPLQNHNNNAPYPPPSSASPPASSSEIHDPSDHYNGMPPPPPSTFPDLPTLMTACQTHARLHGYACVTSSNNYKRGIAYVRCDRGGTYANHWHLTPETRQRHNRTRRLVGCTWKARAKRLKSGEWELRMMEDKHSGHGRSGDAKSHPSLRKLDPGAVEVARGLFAEAKGPKEVLEVLRGWNASVTAQDVYNLKAKIARETSGGGGGGSARKGRGVGGTHEGRETGIEAVDPALQGEGVGFGQGGRAPPARMQDVDMLESSVDGNASAATAAAAAAVATGHRCECKCCEH